MSKFHERGKAKAEAKKQERDRQPGPKEPPSQLTLPGGVVVKGYAFRITACDSEGRPTAFEIARGNEDSDCVLWASPTFMDRKLPYALDLRWRNRIEESIEGPEYQTEQRTYVKGRSVGISTVHVDPKTHDALKQRLLVGDKSTPVTVLGHTSTGDVAVQVEDPEVIEQLKKGTGPVSIEGRVSEVTVDEIDDEPPLECCPRFTWGDGTHDLDCKKVH